MKLSKFGFLIIVLSIVFYGCGKDEFSANSADQFTMPDELVLDVIPNIVNGYNMEEHIANPEDADDEKISMQLFEIGMAARALFTDNTYNEAIISEARNHDNYCTSLETFIHSSRGLMQGEHQHIFDNLEQLAGKVDLTHASTNPKNLGEIEHYIPAIFVVNAETADFSKKPIISPGTYVNASLPGMEKYDDHIVAWYADDTGEFKEILISEATAKTTTHPIFIIDNAEEEVTTRPRSVIDYETPSTSRNPETAQYSSREYQINYRYEGSGRSEFCITGAHINESGSVLLICRRDNGTFNTWKEIASVHKDDIGDLLNHWEQFCSNNVTPFNTNYIFWNTYERDWANSNKSLGSASRNGSTIYLYGNRKYSSEWYAYDPNSLSSNPVDLNTIYSSWAKWHNNYKGKLRIWRVQP